MNHIKTLDNMVALSLNFSIWTGQKMLPNTNISANNKELPSDLFKLGLKHTSDPEALKVFTTLKRRAERACLKVGIPFLGGYAIPAKAADGLAIILSDIKKEYDDHKQKYLAIHESIQQDWISSYPEYSDVLEKALTPVEVVEKRIKANFTMFKVSSPDNITTSADVDTGLEEEVEALSNSLDEDILKSANHLAESLSKAMNPNRANVNGLKRLREKVEGLAFLNGKYNKLIQVIKSHEDMMPVAGKLNPSEVTALSGLLYRMSEPKRLEALMSNINESGDTVQPEPSVQPEHVNTVISETDFEFDCGDDEEETTSQPFNATFF